MSLSIHCRVCVVDDVHARSCVVITTRWRTNIMRRFVLALIALALPFPLAAQRAAAATSASFPSLSVAVRPGVMEAPDSTPGGWTRLELTKTGRHVVVVFRLREGADPAAFLAALDTARMTPSMGEAVGGPEVLSVSSVLLNLTPGRYVVACMVRDTPNARRHHVAGESRTFVVAPKRSANRAAATPPRAEVEVHMFDFAYRAPERWPARAKWVRVSNEGKEDHLMLIARLREGATLREWAAAPATDTVTSKQLTGVARTSPGGVVYLPFALTPGRYVLYCRIQHSASGTLHEKMGMIKEITVE
jgi:hypothetical protein